MFRYIKKLSSEKLQMEIEDLLHEDCTLKWRHIMLFHLMSEKLNRMENEDYIYIEDQNVLSARTHQAV